jgi:membrane peptidoglycan carboxypeptidase
LNKLNGICLPRTDQKCSSALLVGSANPNYIDQISPYLRKSVLTTEDPSFFSHRGFITEAFKQSIVKKH